MRPRDATRSLKAVTCVNNTQNSRLIIAFGSTQVQRDLSCSGAVVDAAGCSCSAWGATAAVPTAATDAGFARAGGNCRRRANGSDEALRALPIIAMPRERGDAENEGPWPINLPPKSKATS